MQLLGAQADRVQGALVTVDPERDTDAIVDAYVKGFDPRFTGMRFDAATTAAIAREFRVAYSQTPLPNSKLGDAIDHTALSYMFDPHGRVRLVARHEQPAGRSPRICAGCCVKAEAVWAPGACSGVQVTRADAAHRWCWAADNRGGTAQR